MKTVNANLDKTVEEWLDAREGYQRYLEATERLFNLFAEAWCGPRRGIVEAFNTYCEALLSECGYKHLLVRQVYPNRKPGSE